MGQRITSGYDVSLFDRYTANKIIALLEKDTPISQKLKNLIVSKPAPHIQQTNVVSAVLKQVYHHSHRSLYPVWMSKFIFAKKVKRAEKISFVKEFGPMLTFSHTILRLSEKAINNNEPSLKNKYITKWEKEQLKFYKQLESFDPKIKLETNHDKFLQLKFYPDTNLSSDIQKLVKIRQQYSGVIKNKIRPPDLNINIDPNRFGDPPNAERVFNMRLSRLVKLQNYYLKYPPIAQEDMKELNSIDLNSLSGSVREGYVEFLTNSVFTIDEDTQITKSNILEKRVAISDKIKTLYKELK